MLRISKAHFHKKIKKVFHHSYKQYILTGQCGVCGDPFDMNPQPHADGGKYSNGIIAKTYTKGQVIDVHVQVVVSHKGTCTLKSFLIFLS